MNTSLSKTFLCFIFLLFSYAAYPQIQWIDSVKKVLQTEKEDTNKLHTLFFLVGHYIESHADTGVTYSQQALDLAEKLNLKDAILAAEGSLSLCLIIAGNYPLGLDHAFKTLALAKKMNSSSLGWAYSTVSYSYYYLGEYNTCLSYTRQAMKIAQPYEIAYGWRDLALVFHKLNEPDSAMLYTKKAYEQLKDGRGNIFGILGDAYAGKGDYDSALLFYRTGVTVALRDHIQPELIDNYNNIAAVYRIKNNFDSATWYAKKVLSEKVEKSYPLGLLKGSNILADIYDTQNKPDSVLKYLRIALTIKDSLFSREKTMAVQNLAFKEQEKLKEIEESKLKYRNRLRMYSLLGGLIALLVIAGILLRNNRNKQKANNLILQQKQKVESTLSELKSTQTQLIQSEKMASLGELTAGIAHEIQNPLNFVNNFSEINKELLVEMNEEIKKGNFEAVQAISNDITENEEKIHQHGSRADAIVKGMLQHSRTSSGQKELTDINKLTDEYLRLSYHGLRAKDKSFNANFQTRLDDSIGQVNIIPQEIGRVILNLVNNAFYAVGEKAKTSQHPEGRVEYEPLVTVSTKRLGDRISISVVDNGNGIPQKILDKIFQPFFTTKPTGQGTGLGLSLAYDIVKAHKGEIRVETKDGEGSEFIIQLPQT
jgi:two-component system NtrC family sensor kinase